MMINHQTQMDIGHVWTYQNVAYPIPLVNHHSAMKIDSIFADLFLQGRTQKYQIVWFHWVNARIGWREICGWHRDDCFYCRASFPVKQMVDFLFTQSNQIILGFTMFYDDQTPWAGNLQQKSILLQKLELFQQRFHFPRETLRPMHIYIFQHNIDPM